MKRITVRLAKEPSAKGAAPSLRAHLDIVVGKRSPSPRPSPPRRRCAAMSLHVRTFSSAFAALSNAAKTMNHSGGCIALPLLGERAGVREVHLSSTTMKRCASSQPGAAPQEEACRLRSPALKARLMMARSPSIFGKMGRAFSPESYAVGFPGALPQAGMIPRLWRSTKK